MTDSTTDARVTTITAEVRVLMVGSRQVTLSVAKQLDHVDLGGIEPFGRVRLGDRVEVIGRSREDGTLVLARLTDRPSRVPHISEDDLDPDVESMPIICDKMMTDYDDLYRLRLGDRDIRLYVTAVSRCGKHPRGIASTGECGHWDPNGHEKPIRAAIRAWDEAVALYDKADALPLIVLAGLR